MRIIIVEDEVAVREVLSEYLSRFGYIITALGTGREALDQLQKRRFDVAIVDWKLPGITGRDVILELLSSSPQTRILATTGQVTQHLRHMATTEPRIRIVAKPFSLRQLHRLITASESPNDRLSQHAG